MAQEASFTMPDGLLEHLAALEATWPASLAALHAAGIPLCLYDDLSDDQLIEKANELGVAIATDADRATIVAAIAAKEKPAPRPWGDDKDFDPDKAWSLIENLRADRKRDRERLEALEKAERDREDAAKTEEQRREEARQRAEQEAKESKIEAARLRVALAKGFTETQAKRLIGETEEELAADADELLATFTSEGEGEGEQVSLPRRPQPRLRPGAAPVTRTEETDPDKLAARVPRQFGR